MTRRVYVAGHRGLLGRALERVLPGADLRLVHDEHVRIDLRDPVVTGGELARTRPDVVVLVAARVGGLGANLADPVGCFELNLRIQLSVLRAAHEAGVQRLLFVGSANAYPRDAAQPITESSLGAGVIDPDTEPYGLAKLTGMRLCAAYRRQHGVRFHSVVPCNLYGPGDRFEGARAHVVAAMLRRFAKAAAAGADEVTVWGTGEQRRQVLHVDDLARACALLLDVEDPPDHVNAAPSGDVSVRELAEAAAATVGYAGSTRFDPSRPEGVRRRELDPSALMALGWSPRIDLASGLRDTWDWYRSSRDTPAPAPR